MDETGLAQFAGIVGAGGAALAILAGRRITLVAGFVLLGVAEALLAVSMAGTDALDKVASPAALAAALAGAVLVAASAAVFVRYPLLVIPALVLAAPFRLPFDFDRDHRFFFALAEGGRLGRLIPLYAVLTAAAAAFLYRSLRRVDVTAPPRVIALPAAAFLALASVSLALVGGRGARREPARVLPPPLRRNGCGGCSSRAGTVAAEGARDDRSGARHDLRARRALAAG